MKKMSFLVVAALVLIANAAMADSIARKIGVSVRGGFTVPADSEFSDGTKIETDTGWNVGGGVIYGINDNFAAALDVIYSEVDAKTAGINIGTAKTADISLGVQYRFMPKSALVPYVGAGIDVLVNDFSPNSNLLVPGSLDTDTTIGGHLCGGIDFFVNKNVALNAELRGLLASEADVKDGTGFAGAKYDPSNFSGLFGVRVFFD